MKAVLWKNCEYLKYYASYFLGNVGDWFDFFALQIIFAHTFNASAGQIVNMLAAYIAPMIILSSFAGTIADKFDKKWLLFMTDLLAGLITVAIIFASTMYMALTLIAIRSAIIAFNAAGQKVASRLLLPESLQLKATSAEQVAFQLCRVIGPLLGAIVVAISSAKMCLGINAVSFFVSSAILLFLRPIKAALTEKKAPVVDDAKASNFKMVYHFIKGNQLLKFFIPTVLVGGLFIMMVELQLVILLRDIIPAKPNLLGYVTGISALGSIVSALYLQKRGDLQQFGLYMVGCFLLVGLAYTFMGLYQPAWPIVYFFIASFLSGLGLGVVFVLQPYVIKRESPKESMGRISGVLSTAQGASFAVGVGFGGTLIGLLGARDAFILIGVLCLLGGFVSFLLKHKMRAEGSPPIETSAMNTAP